MADVLMPRLSDTMAEGVLSQWLKKEGDPVRKGDVLAEIETDKATMELEAYDEGVLDRLLVPEGATVPIGQPIAVISDSNHATAAPAAGTPPAPAAPPPRPPGPEPAKPAAPPAAGTQIRTSPLARKIASSHGIN
ncbi:MAG: biotin/lipoyl-containing protein, partial [Streptosporangiaceae bacterium]